MRDTPISPHEYAQFAAFLRDHAGALSTALSSPIALQDDRVRERLWRIVDTLRSLAYNAERKQALALREPSIYPETPE